MPNMRSQGDNSRKRDLESQDGGKPNKKRRLSETQLQYQEKEKARKENEIESDNKKRAERLELRDKHRKDVLAQTKKVLPRVDRIKERDKRKKALEKIAKTIQERLKPPELPPEAKLALDTMKDYLEDSKDKSSDEYIDAFKTVAETVSPDTMKDYDGVEFVSTNRTSHPFARKNEKGEFEFVLPTGYPYPIQGLIHIWIDETLMIESMRIEESIRASDDQAQLQGTASGDQAKIQGTASDGQAQLQGTASDGQAQIPDTDALMERRVEMAVRVFQADALLDGWGPKGYKMAKDFEADRKEGIFKGLLDGSIKKNASGEDLWRIGGKYAHEKLLARSKKRPKGVPRLFPPRMPGACYEELHIEGRVKTKYNSTEPEIRFEKMKPIHLNSPEFYTLMDEDINTRNEKIKLNVFIRPDTTIWVLPTYTRDGAKTQHSTLTEGDFAPWLGAATFKDKNVKLKDKAGHGHTFSYDKNEQKAIDDFAIGAFRKYGYDVPDGVEHARATKKGRILQKKA